MKLAALAAVLSAVPVAWAQTCVEPIQLLSPPAPSVLSGWSVAIDDDLVVVGARLDAAGAPGGSAHVFRRNGALWEFEATLRPPGPNSGDNFGFAVAVSDARIVVGAARDDLPGMVDAGAAHVFEHGPGGWSHIATLTASNASPVDFFGSSVAMQGDRIVVGSWLGPAGPTHPGSGAVHVFEPGLLGLEEVAMLAPPASTVAATFGYAVALDGDRVAVGAPGNSPLGTEAGACYTYTRDAQGNWTLEQSLFPPTTGPSSFGSGVAIDGPNLLIGAPGDPANPGGSVHAYTNSAGVWTPASVLVASDPAVGAEFGAALAMDGPLAVIGAPFDPRPSAQAGAVYVFRRGLTGWYQATELFSPALPLGLIGWSVALDRGVAAIGVPTAQPVGRVGLLDVAAAGCLVDLTTTAIPGSPGYGEPNCSLTNDDFFYYLLQFAAGNLAVADLTTGAVPGQPGFGTPNGIINNDDFFYFLALFSAGC